MALYYSNGIGAVYKKIDTPGVIFQIVDFARKTTKASIEPLMRSSSHPFFVFRVANDMLRKNSMDALEKPKMRNIVLTNYFPSEGSSM